MAHDIIMPALGMAQDTGLLVAWRKAPGDKVAVGDALFEVETDKATMEVEAGFAGFLSSVTASEGQDVPVGQVIARIVDSEAEVQRTATPAQAEAAPAAAEAPVSAPAAPPATIAPPGPLPVPQPVAPLPVALQPVAPGKAPLPKPVEAPGRILASPKARVMAAEQGLDLARLVRAGHPQPYHVADLDRLRGLQTSARSSLSARVDGSALQALLQKATQADMAQVLTSFARRAWETVSDQPLTVALLRPDGSRTGEGALLLVDLTATRLTAYCPPEGLVLAVARDGARDGTAVTLTLSFDEADLPFATAAAWLNDTAARVEDPLRQLI